MSVVRTAIGSLQFAASEATIVFRHVFFHRQKKYFLKTNSWGSCEACLEPYAPVAVIVVDRDICFTFYLAWSFFWDIRCRLELPRI
jgi:hypothetical protein